MRTTHADPRVDPDFAADVLADLYRYPNRRLWVAALLWLTLGWAGAHRFYLGRSPTALIMLVTGGGLLVWWAIDGFLIARMVRAWNADQETRKRLGDPPRELDFMPRLQQDVLARPPEWTEQWQARGPGSRVSRMIGDVFVLLVTGISLGAVAVRTGVYEAIVAVVVLAGLTSAGAAFSARLNHWPVLRALVRWSHRLRLFYYYNRPGSPLALLFRPVTAAITAPFRRRSRAEVRIYLQLGGVLTALFLVIDLGEAVLEAGIGALGPLGLFTFWMQEAALTFIVIYAYATPIGAVLTLHLLTRRTHTVPRLLSALVVFAVLVGLVR